VIIFSLGALNPESSLNWAALLTIILFIGLVAALGEEIGWRGFLTSHYIRTTSEGAIPEFHFPGFSLESVQFDFKGEFKYLY